VAQRIAGHADSQTTKSFYEPPRGEKFSSKIGLVGLAYGVWTNHTRPKWNVNAFALFS